MTGIIEGDLLWSPTSNDIESSRLTKFSRFVSKRTGRSFANYEELWDFSVTEVELFWNLIWDFFEVIGYRPVELQNSDSELNNDQKRMVLSSYEMPGAHWFPGSRCNYAENVLSHRGDGIAVISYSEANPSLEYRSFDDLYSEVAKIQGALLAHGVSVGDRVAAYAPNVFETLAFFLASASIGAVWSSCSPDFGVSSVIDRLSQIEPKILFVADGYRYGGKDISRVDQVAEIEEMLDSVEVTVVMNHLGVGSTPKKGTKQRSYEEFINTGSEGHSMIFTELDFSHPLWILYSSGTTGLPKAIVHSHGGIVLEHLKAVGLHTNIGSGDRFFWFTSTGWMMWNYLIGGLLHGGTIVLYDGSPNYPDLNVLWELAQNAGINYFGTSAAYIQGCQKAKIQPKNVFDLSRIHGIGSSGSPLSPEGFEWLYQNVSQTAQVSSISGGTDLCTAFLGSTPWHECRAGEISARCLGAKVASYQDDGTPGISTVGELIIEAPMPSMPVGFWNDNDGTLYKNAYFEFLPGKWRHGDWLLIKPSGACVIYGRSDSTLNRSGIRMGTSEFYRVVESFDEIEDSLVIDTSHLGRPGKLLTFLVLRPDAVLSDELKARIAGVIKSELSPRYVPDEIIQISEVPRTLSGKKMEIPMKRILLGEDPAKVVANGAVANPKSIDTFIDLARTTTGG